MHVIHYRIMPHKEINTSHDKEPQRNVKHILSMQEIPGIKENCSQPGQKYLNMDKLSFNAIFTSIKHFGP